MLTGHFSGELVAAKRRADAGMLVSRDRNSDTRAADKDSARALARCDLLAKSVNGNGVVAALGGLGTNVGHIVALCLEVLDEIVFVIKSCVVARNYKVLVFHFFIILSFFQVCLAPPEEVGDMWVLILRRSFCRRQDTFYTLSAQRNKPTDI